MKDRSQKRSALAARINRLMFMEYGADAVGWFKVAPTAELGKMLSQPDAETIARYVSTPTDSETDREVIRVFLSNWLCAHQPETVGAYALEPAEFRPIGRDEALAVVDRIVAVSQENPKVRIGGCLDWLEPAGPEEASDVPYTQLRVWFDELFGEECRFYLHDFAGGPSIRFDTDHPGVLGLAPDMIGFLWLQ